MALYLLHYHRWLNDNKFYIPKIANTLLPYSILSENLSVFVNHIKWLNGAFSITLYNQPLMPLTCTLKIASYPGSFPLGT